MYRVADYPGYHAFLDVEVRATRSPTERAGEPSLAIHFIDGEAQKIPQGEIRQEEGVTVYPVEFEVIEHRHWSIAVIRDPGPERPNTERYRFELPMPDSPAGAIPWSGWIRPVRKKGWDTTADVTLRYRWALVPR